MLASPEFEASSRDFSAPAAFFSAQLAKYSTPQAFLPYSAPRAEREREEERSEKEAVGEMPYYVDISQVAGVK